MTQNACQNALPKCITTRGHDGAVSPFNVGLFHPLLDAGLSRRFRSDPYFMRLILFLVLALL